MRELKNNLIKYNSPKNINETIEIGKCIKIKNCDKDFQIIGINHKRAICWVREWPLNFNPYKTFTLSINKIVFSTVCKLVKN